ncbi:MAG: OmpA family protein [Pseudomonadota bacterium]
MTRFLALLAAATLGLSGCVLKTQYDQTVTDQLKCSEALKSAAAERDQLRLKYEDAKKQNSDLDVRNTELSTTNQMLAGKNSEFANKCIESQKEMVRTKEERDAREKEKARQKQLADDLATALKEEIDTGEVTLISRPEGPAAVAEDPVLFVPGRDQLQPAGKKLLEKLASLLRKAPEWKVSVEGHTDSAGLSGVLKKKYLAEWDWSTAKALKALRQLELAGVEGRRLSAAGFGEFHPLATNANEAGRKKNRRVEFVFSSYAPPPP